MNLKKSEGAGYELFLIGIRTGRSDFEKSRSILLSETAFHHASCSRASSSGCLCLHPLNTYQLSLKVSNVDTDKRTFLKLDTLRFVHGIYFQTPRLCLPDYPRILRYH